MMETTERHGTRRDPLYDTARQAARRLTIGVPALHRLINIRVIPAQSVNGRRKIAKLVVGKLLASAYEIWPPEHQPHYSIEELRRLSGITVEEVAAELGLGRTAGYQGVRNHQVPAVKLPNLDRWVVPEDVVAQMEVYDLKNLPTAPLSDDECRSRWPACKAEEPAAYNDGAGEGTTRDQGNLLRGRALHVRLSPVLDAGRLSSRCHPNGPLVRTEKLVKSV